MGHPLGATGCMILGTVWTNWNVKIKVQLWLRCVEAEWE
jgi:acetyl-CoA acetyltransferase